MSEDEGKLTYPEERGDELNDTLDVQLDIGSDVKQTVLDRDVSESLESGDRALEDIHKLFEDGG